MTRIWYFGLRLVIILINYLYFYWSFARILDTAYTVC